MKEVAATIYVNDICDIVKRHHRFLITAHVRADGDAIGSEIALYYALKDMGKSVSIANDSAVPQVYRFIVPNGGYTSIPNFLKRKRRLFLIRLSNPDRLGKTRECIPKMQRL